MKKSVRTPDPSFYGGPRGFGSSSSGGRIRIPMSVPILLLPRHPRRNPRSKSGLVRTRLYRCEMVGGGVVGAPGTGVSHFAYCGTSPRIARKKTFMIERVIGPGTLAPIV